MQTKLKIAIVSGVIFTIFALWSGYKVWSFWYTPLVAANQEPVKVVFAHGESAKKVATILKEQRLTSCSICFLLYVRLSGVEHKLHAGEYTLEPGITLPQLIDKMVTGKALRHAITLVEGWTFSQIVNVLNSNPYLTHTISGLSEAEIMAQIGHTGELPEGRFATDTYLFSGKVTDKEILRRSYNLMDKRLNAAWEQRAPEVKYHCPYEALIVASLIEKETAIEQEKPIVAGVILRRLARGMLLQVDPTVIYGLGHKFTGKLSKANLAKDTPYNTYLHKGLPPTPIASPGSDSLIAALHPATDNFLYYVAKKDGTHQFATSLAEQSANIKKHLLRK